MRPRDYGGGAAPRGEIPAAWARALTRVAAAACLCVLAACAAVPDADALIELHARAVTLQRPSAHQGNADGPAQDQNNISRLQGSRLP